ncbi:stage II sporulation protein P [Metabacillus herbersteinensis]|uniref:Stage II sporulation protein P n=1 Tax=Metabacillus herbersteinensis TaxID=283816 RepID=A0ABV6GM94_9BACI
MSKKKSVIESFKYINVVLLCITWVFILATIIIFSSFKFSNSTLSEFIENIEVTDVFIHFIGSENHYFYGENEKQEFSINEVAFNLATNIKLGDVRSLLGREIPGFSIYDTEIVVAGEGTNYTNLPMESSPPLEVLLKEREVAEENLAEFEKKANMGSKVKDAPPKTAEGKKNVYIYHSHSWEAFAPLLKNVENPDEANSSNEKVNVLAVGSKLSEELSKRGIGAEHDTTNVTEGLQERKWNYNHSYKYSRERVQEAIAGNNELNFLIDIHRDSQPKKITTTTIGGKPYARLFFIVGKEHSNYEQNLQLAKEINAKLEAKFPGISRGVFVKGKSQGNGVYNQDLTDRALLLEFGGVDNELPELYNSIEAFAKVFSDSYWKDAEGI